MRYVLYSTMIAASAFVLTAPASAATTHGMHSARVMVRQSTDTRGAYYEVMMNGRMYGMAPMADFQRMRQAKD